MHDYAREQKDKNQEFKTNRLLSQARNKIKLMANENGTRISEAKINELAFDLAQEMVSGTGNVNAKLVSIEDDMRYPQEVKRAPRSAEVKQAAGPADAPIVKRIKTRNAKNKNKTPAANKNKSPDTVLNKTAKRGEQDNGDEDVQATVRRSKRASRIDRLPENKEQVDLVSPKVRRQLAFNDDASPGEHKQASPVRPVAPPPAGHEEQLKVTAYALEKPYVLAVRNAAGDNSKNIYVKDYNTLQKVMDKFNKSFLRTNKGNFYKQSNLLKYAGGKPVTINGQEYSLREFSANNQDDMSAATSMKLYEKDVASMDQRVNEIIQIQGQQAQNQQEVKEQEQKDEPVQNNPPVLSKDQMIRVLKQRKVAIEKEQRNIIREQEVNEAQVKNLQGYVLDQAKLQKQLEPKNVELSKRFHELKLQDDKINDMLMDRKPLDLSSVQDQQPPQVPQVPQVPQDGKLSEHAQIEADKQNAPPDSLALLDNRAQIPLIDQVGRLDQQDLDEILDE
jgi:hypothetical protein